MTGPVHATGEAALPAQSVAWVQDFLDYLASQRRASPHTLEAYRRDLSRLLEFAAATPLAELAPQHVRRFAARLHGQGLGARSLARCLSAWRSLYRWLVRQHGLGVNPVEGIRAPRAPRKLPKTLSPDQTQALLDAEPQDLLEFRDRAMFELFYSSGLRLAELASLDVSGGLDLAQGQVTVTGKRRRTRVVPVGSKACAALAAWLGMRDDMAAVGEPALFVSRRGGRLSAGMIRVRLARWAQQQGLAVHVHPHMLRHSFASHVLQSSQDLRAVQELLGHASIRTTQVYTHLDFQHLAQVYDAAHPRAKKP
jgi:integrase/recombinase XerC